MITSADGTAIGCATTGTGPGLLVIPGPLEAAADYEKFADALADTFTVHVVDRRGRGESGPLRAGHGLSTEVEDVSAVARATGAQLVLGVSSGAVIALQAALRLPSITHVAAYEPPIDLLKYKAGVIARFEREVAAGQHVEAIITLFKGLEFGPRLLRMVPRRALAAAIRKAPQDEADEMIELLPGLRLDFKVVEEGSANLARFSALRGEVLLIGGTKSPRYLTHGLYALADLLPDAEKILVEEADHFSPSNEPNLVLPAFRGFFTA
jgi:pimeloyl-ACP methyl ester carboxylesterase